MAVSAQTNRQTNRQTDSLSGTTFLVYHHSSLCTDKQTDRQTNRQTHSVDWLVGV